MAVLDSERDAVVIRIVYDGPPHAGKTTSVRSLARSLSRSVETPLEAEGRTLFFDWMEYTGGLFEGHQIRCQIVSVPGQPDFAARRRALLETADVVVFVADTSDRGAVARSASHVREMIHILRGLNGPPVGVVVQANKRDLPSALPRDEVTAAFGDDFRRSAVTESVADSGVGIRETFVLAVRLALDRIRELMARGTLPQGTPTIDTAEQLLKQLEELDHGEQDKAPDDREAPALEPATLEAVEIEAAAASEPAAVSEPPAVTEAAAVVDTLAIIEELTASEPPAVVEAPAAIEPPASIEAADSERAIPFAPRARIRAVTEDDETVVFDPDELAARARRADTRSDTEIAEIDDLDVEQLVDAASTDDAWTVDTPYAAPIPLAASQPTTTREGATEIRIYEARIAEARNAASEPAASEPAASEPAASEPEPPPAPPSVTDVTAADDVTPADGTPALDDAPPRDTERLNGAARPRLPDARVPSGAIWPPVEGRMVLHEAATADLILHKVGDADWIAGLGTGWRIHSSGNDTYASFDEGREALLDWSRLHSLHADLLSPTRCVALAEAGGQRWRLWQIVKLSPSLRTWIVDGAELDASELFGRLSTAAMVLGEAHARTAQTQLPATLDSIGRGPLGPQFVALMPTPHAGPPPRLSDITERIVRELTHLLAAELIERRSELAALVESTEGWRTPWDDLVATAIGRD